MRSVLHIALALSLMLTTSSVSAVDFHLLMRKCSTTVGYLVLSDESLKTVEGTPTLTSCTRAGKALKCEIRFEDGSQPPKHIQYQIQIDSPPKLVFSDAHSGDWIMVDTAQHAAVIISRVVDQQFAAAKVCQGTFATQNEIEMLQK